MGQRWYTVTSRKTLVFMFSQRKFWQPWDWGSQRMHPKRRKLLGEEDDLNESLCWIYPGEIPQASHMCRHNLGYQYIYIFIYSYMAFPKVLLVSYDAFSTGEFWKETCFSHQLRNKGFLWIFHFHFFSIIFSFTFFVCKSMNNFLFALA